MVKTRKEANRRHHRGVKSACTLYRKEVIDPRRKKVRRHMKTHPEVVAQVAEKKEVKQ